MPSKGQITKGKRQFPEDYALRSNESSDFKDKPIGARNHGVEDMEGQEVQDTQPILTTPKASMHADVLPLSLNQTW